MASKWGTLLNPHFFEQKNGRDNNETDEANAAKIIYESHECRLADKLLVD